MAEYYELPEPSPILGYMPMPESFPYMKALLHGRPKHEKYDDFWRKHPPMDVRKRAKIFAPFSALKGFEDHIASKEREYEERRTLSEEKREELDRKIAIIRSATGRCRAGYPDEWSGQKYGQGMRVSITFFSECTDPFSDYYGSGGRYETVSGYVKKIDNIVSRTIVIDDRIIPLEDVAEIELCTH